MAFTLTFFGTSDLGTLYGVIDFLERECGIRWYLPGEIGEVVPKKATIKTSTDGWRHQPWTRHRFIAYPRRFPKSLYWWQREYLFEFQLPPNVTLTSKITGSWVPVPDEVKSQFKNHNYTFDSDADHLYDKNRDEWKVKVTNKTYYYLLRKDGNMVEVFRQAIAEEKVADIRELNRWWLHLKMKYEFQANHNYEWFYNKYYFDPKKYHREPQTHPNYHPEFFASGYKEPQPCFFKSTGRS